MVNLKDKKLDVIKRHEVYRKKKNILTGIGCFTVILFAICLVIIIKAVF